MCTGCLRLSHYNLCVLSHQRKKGEKMNKSFPFISSSWVLCLPMLSCRAPLPTSSSECQPFSLLHHTWWPENFSAESSPLNATSCDSAIHISAFQARYRKLWTTWLRTLRTRSSLWPPVKMLNISPTPNRRNWEGWGDMRDDRTLQLGFNKWA